MTEKEVLLAMCGVDENEDTKAQIMIETKYVDVVKGEEKRVGVIDLHGPVVNCFRSHRFMNVDVQFDSASDPELINCIRLLKDFNNPENSMDSNNNLVPIVQLTLMPISLGGEYFASGVHGSWTIIPSQMNRLPDTIRFIFVNGDFFTYRVNESADDLEMEG